MLNSLFLAVKNDFGLFKGAVGAVEYIVTGPLANLESEAKDLAIDALIKLLEEYKSKK